MNVIGNISQTGIIISSGTGNNYFAGNLGIGTTNPNAKLSFNGSIALPVNNNSAIGVNVTMLSVTDITRTDTSGNMLGTYSAADMAVGVAYAREAGDFLSLGINAKMISSKIENEQASAYGIDIGGTVHGNR
ncbi:MAG: hypothetical protein LHV68_13245 [Elusimicrobia bacterium]|nr:hypothetical protein [Candidatus Liberimonas magnetica]